VSVAEAGIVVAEVVSYDHSNNSRCLHGSSVDGLCNTDRI
jgi:hypothetical protein